MKSKPFKYAVLKYRPSYLLDERVNLGLFFLFPEDNRVEFVAPTHLHRLKALHPGTDLQQVKSYLYAFRNQARKIQKRDLFVEASRERLLEEEFLIPDGNAFFFSDWKPGFYQTIEPVLEKYRQEYFSLYAEGADGRHNDKWLAQQFHELLKQDHSRELFFLQNRELANPRAHATFDFAWKNGSINLVKTLGFDLKAPETILNKSNLWFGKLTQLEQEIEQRSAKVDFILARPQSSDIAIQNAFDGACEVLASLKVANPLKFDSELSEYAAYALESVQEPPAELIALPGNP